MLFALKWRLGKLLKYPLFRQLWFERWFRWAFIAFVLMVLAIGLSLPKIWRTSESGFLPIIKVSVLDLVQAWSLQRTAVKASAARNFEEANYAWLSALANNQADPELVRGFLRNVREDPHRQKRAGQAISHSFWLLRLTGTNIADLELVSEILSQYKYFDPVVSLVDEKYSELTPALAKTYLKALFNLGRMDTFNARWGRMADEVKKDPEMALYRAAYLAGWGEPGTITAARAELDAATRDPNWRILAWRLRMAVSARELDPRSYGESLGKLEEARQDQLSDHCGYWRLLVFTGKNAEAMQRAKAYPQPPTTPAEVVELAQVYVDLDLRDQALEIYERYANPFMQAPIYAISYANELMEAKRWEQLRQIALRLRTGEGTADQLGGFSYFLEGRADWGLSRTANAEDCFRKTGDAEFPYPGLGLRVAGHIFQLGQVEPAKKVLLRIEKPLEEDPAYWSLLFSIADALKDVDLLVKAATRAYELRPNDPAMVNNYAAALIITRKNPQEVIKMTLQLFAQNPNSLHAVVNHAAALLLNDRAREAEILLGRVQTNTLSKSQLALYNLDLFEAYLGLQKYDLAWSISDQIEVERLYPSQREWLESRRQQLPPRDKSG